MKTVFDNIAKKIQVDLLDFFDKYENFVQFSLQSLVIFYKNNSDNIPSQAFKELQDLKEEAKWINDQFQFNFHRLDNCEEYEYFDLFEDIYYKLETYENLSKWLKSDKFSISTSNHYQLSERETIEQASQKIGYENRDEGFLELTIDNHIKETDYDLSGGKLFSYSMMNSGEKLKLESIVDRSIVGQKVYGIDLDQNVNFIQGDLKILSPKDTFIQTCSILLNLKLNDNPEFPNDGLDKTLLSDRVIAATTFPIVLRQLMKVISKDDTIKSFELGDMRYERDAIILDLNFYSHLSTLINLTYEN